MINKAVRNWLQQQTKSHAFCGTSSSIFLYNAQDNDVESALSCVETGFFQTQRQQDSILWTRLSASEWLLCTHNCTVMASLE